MTLDDHVPKKAEPRRSWSARILLTAWIVLAVVVVGAGAWVAWLYLGTNSLAQNSVRHAKQRFEEGCRSGGHQPSDGSQVIGLIRFDRSDDSIWPILAGTSDRELNSGVAWYPDSAAPAQVGNTVLAGYRITHGAPFQRLYELNEADQIEIITCDQVYVYALDVAPRELTVQASDSWILDPVPGHPGQLPTEQMITLITNQDLIATKDRSVAIGHLESSHSR